MGCFFPFFLSGTNARPGVTELLQRVISYSHLLFDVDYCIVFAFYPVLTMFFPPTDLLFCNRFFPAPLNLP